MSELAPAEQDPAFQHEQQHLTDTYAKLRAIARQALEAMEKTAVDAAADKESMAAEIAMNMATDDDLLEMQADFEAMNAIIQSYNLSQTVQAEKLRAVELLLDQPYFAKIVLRFKKGAAPKELYIGAAGISDENYRRLIVDWRSPVAEVYYNQSMGPTSYEADGRTIACDLELRRQFEIDHDQLIGYFDSDVAIQDALLLKSLSRQRSDQMQAITATIQKEQNTVIRHEDVPALLVAGVAGSGKTSVLMQRIAYLFYQHRGDLDPSQVFLLSPNPVFGHYIDNVLPDLGESNPEILTWEEFMAPLLPEGRGPGEGNVTYERLQELEEAAVNPMLQPHDFLDITVNGVKLISAESVNKLWHRFEHIPAGPHRVTLVREELLSRLEGRLHSMAASERTQDEILALSLDEQLHLFSEPFDPQTEEEMRQLALIYLEDRFGAARELVRQDCWLNVDRVGERLLDCDGISSVEWVYLKILLTGMGNPDARYVMVDEVQDYATGQLAVLARYFRRARFLLLGDPNQAITQKSSTYDQIRFVFEELIGHVEECRLTTSYRSTPAITDLFARLMPADSIMEVSSVQREEQLPRIIECEDKEQWDEAMAEVLANARERGGLTAIVTPWPNEAIKLARRLQHQGVRLLTEQDLLPSEGIIVLPLKLAKGLEFDNVIIPDASESVFSDNDISRRRLYTAISRATGTVSILTRGPLTELLA